MQICQFCWLAEASMLGKLQETLSEDNEPNFVGDDARDLNAAFKAAIEMVSEAWGESFNKQVYKFLRVIVADCFTKKETGRILTRDWNIKIQGCD